jgi:protein gp37
MGANSKIEWCHHTFNPWVGCTPVSRACDFCYAEAWAKRTGHPELWQGQRRRTTAANWREPLKWNRAAAAAGERHRVFCASLADVFDNQVPAQWREDLWGLIRETPSLDWLLLTKRPQNIAGMLPAQFDEGDRWPERWPNVWLGTTVENQDEADRRIPHLLAVPARGAVPVVRAAARAARSAPCRANR